MTVKFRKSGIKALGDIPWGTHICQLYESKEELLEVLVPWFSEGLRSGELCVWITSGMVSGQDALDALKLTVPDLASHIKKGAMIIKPFDGQYLDGGQFCGQKALDGWARLLEDASKAGFEGLRLTGDTSWVDESARPSFMEYEREVQRLFRKSRMLTICSYPVSGLKPSDIAEAVSSHGAALVKKEGSWAALWRAGAADDDHELREKERRCTLITELTSELVFRLEIGAAGELSLEWVTEGLHIETGHSQGDICTLDKLKFVIHPDDRAAFTGSLHKVLAGGQTDTEIRYLAKTGAERWIRVYMVPERYDGTRIIKGVIGRGRDITERKKAEERLLESERKYRGLYESISDGVMKVGMDGRITDCNQPVASMLGRAAQELTAIRYTDLTPPEMKRAEEEILKGRLFQNGFCEYEKEFLTKDGSRVPASVSAWLLKDSGGNAEGFWAFVRDLTESRDAERKILDGENLFNALTLSLPGIFYIVDKNGKILKWNRALEETTEYSRTEIAAMHPVDFFGVGDKKLISEKMEQAFSLGAAEVEAPLVTKDGRSIPFHFRAVQTIIGNEPYLIGTGTDISKWKTAEAALRGAHAELEARVQERTRAITEINRRLKKSEERFRVLVETTSDWVWETDSRGVYTYVSPKVRDVLGYEPGEVLGKTPFDLMAPGEAEKIGAEFKKIVSLKRPFALLENKNIHKDGYEVILETNGAPILDPDGNLLGYRGMDRDITDRKRQEAEQSSIQLQLAQSQKMEAIGVLAGGVAHDFNNLMVIIRLNNSLAMKKSDSAEINSYLEQIDTASERAENLTRQLLIFSRRQPTEITALDLNRKITNTLRMLKRLISENIVISTYLAPDIGLISSDKANIEQIIMNLVINARDAMPGGGKISLRTERVDVGGSSRPTASGSHVKLTVEDTGVGMDGNVIKHIFEPFFSTKGPRGTGLGLAVVHNIIRDLGGWIDVESRPGEGTSFEVYFPSAGDGTKEENADEGAPEELMGAGERVLLVEDETLLRKSVAVVLAKNGYSVLEAGCARDARALFEKEKGRIDLVFSDMVLQDSNGVDLIDDLKGLNAKFKVLITSGYMEVDSSFPAIKEKGYQFLQKPYEIPDLLRSVKQSLGKSI